MLTSPYNLRSTRALYHPAAARAASFHQHIRWHASFQSAIFHGGCRSCASRAPMLIKAD